MYPCGQTFYVSGDTWDQINIEVDELEPSRPTLEQCGKENEYPESREMSIIELDSLSNDTVSQSLPKDIPYIVPESSRR